MGIIFGEWVVVELFLEVNKVNIEDYVIENDCCNLVIFLLDMKNINVCIELGVVICD